MIKEIQTKRNYGIDLLRIVSMIMIVTLHVVGKGGLLSTETSFPRKLVLYFFESACFCAVNCYGMISGFVGYGKKFKLTGIINLWIEVVLYLTAINVIFLIVSPGSVSTHQILTSFIPVSSMKYWYFTSFFALYFFKPFLNRLIEILSKRQTTLFILARVFLVSAFPALFGGNYVGGDIFRLSQGYSFLWLSILYMLGAYIKKYNVGSKIKNSFLLISYIICVLFIIFGVMLIEHISQSKPDLFKFIFPLSYLTELTYTSLLVLLCGIFLVLLFSKLKLSPAVSKATSFFAPATFGVYIIHLHPNITIFYEKFFSPFLNYILPLMAVLIIAAAVGIFICCSLIDKIRIILFKILKIHLLSQKIEKLLINIINKSVDFICKITE